MSYACLGATVCRRGAFLRAARNKACRMCQDPSRNIWEPAAFLDGSSRFLMESPSQIAEWSHGVRVSDLVVCVVGSGRRVVRVVGGDLRATGTG
ncbi:hypothetical protein MTP99_003513 [Tenebrio molitor]|nr:hypothetical protein MTP99_003513 [Tenebrio molitor]